jgi:Rrf2 family protein
MRFSKKTEYALRALFAIARVAQGATAGSWRIEEISRQENIPIKFLEQILLSLRNAGLLASKRGVGGGYRLARPPRDIAVGEVIRALHGPFTPLPCAIPDRRRELCTCPDERTCPVRVLMVDVQARLEELFDGRSLEDILRQVPQAGALSFEI